MTRTRTAEILDRFILSSADGPIEHVRTYCVHRHWFRAPLGDELSDTD